jgi:hypothetical protein
MGQAFDRNGNVLGEAYGETKREVFDKLQAEFKDAAEIRIRSFHQSGDAGPHEGAGAAAEMPRYRSHKDVWALKIAAIEFRPVNAHHDGGATITPADTGFAPFPVDQAYVDKHSPKVGGYYVVYKDGYQSFSPAQAFEEGYARI